MISANLAQNRVRLIHEVDLYTDIYGISGEYGTYSKTRAIKCKYAQIRVIVSPLRSTYGGYYGLVVVTPPPRPQTLHRSHDN